LSSVIDGSVFTTASGIAGQPPADGVAVSATSTYYSAKTNKRRCPSFSYDLYWGTNVGTFTVQCSNKKEPNEANDNDWKTMTLATAIVQPTGSNTGDYADLSDLPFRWVRLKYVNASGTGTIYAFASGVEG
jgi:hypothetical protein